MASSRDPCAMKAALANVRAIPDRAWELPDAAISVLKIVTEWNIM
jgi:hypothetical protein